MNPAQRKHCTKATQITDSINASSESSEVLVAAFYLYYTYRHLQPLLTASITPVSFKSATSPVSVRLPAICMSIIITLISFPIDETCFDRLAITRFLMRIDSLLAPEDQIKEWILRFCAVYVFHHFAYLSAGRVALFWWTYLEGKLDRI